MINRITPSFGQDVMELFLSRAAYLSLHHKPPETDHYSLTEPAFGGYERMPCTWSVEGTYLVSLAAPVYFVGLEIPVLVAAIGVCSATIGNTLLCYAEIDDPAPSGRSTYVVPAGSLKFRVA